MTAAQPEPVVQLEVLDPASPRGKQAAEALSTVLADVRLRLQQDGIPIPAVPQSP